MTTLPLSEVETRLSEIAEGVATTPEGVQITKNGRDCVVSSRQKTWSRLKQPWSCSVTLKRSNGWHGLSKTFSAETCWTKRVLDVDHRRDAHRS